MLYPWVTLTKPEKDQIIGCQTRMVIGSSWLLSWIFQAASKLGCLQRMAYDKFCGWLAECQLMAQ